jgi:hypothetical protein
VVNCFDARSCFGVQVSMSAMIVQYPKKAAGGKHCFPGRRKLNTDHCSLLLPHAGQARALPPSGGAFTAFAAHVDLDLLGLRFGFLASSSFSTPAL